MRKIKKQPGEITPVVVGAVLMPQGEIICMGKTLGWFKDMKDHVYEQPETFLKTK